MPSNLAEAPQILITEGNLKPPSIGSLYDLI